MGWSYGCETRRELIHELTVGWRHGGDGPSRKCLAHCYRGNRYSGVLWTVWAILEADGTERKRFIGCDLMHFRGGEWGYKDLCESMHPYFYSCPLGYLAMVPQVECEDWRKVVREYHAKRTKKLVVGQTYPATKGLRIGSRPIKAIKVTSLKPLMGDAIFENGGWPERVKFSKRHIDGETPVPADAGTVATQLTLQSCV